MSQKRGRPVSLSEDVAVNRRRQLNAARIRAFRQRHQEHQPTTYRGGVRDTIRPYEQIIDLAFNEQDTAETLATLGLRTQGLTLPQDPQDAQLQSDAIAVDEHHVLYSTSPTDGQSTRDRVHRDLPARVTSFFPSLPPTNPFPSISIADPTSPVLSVDEPPTPTAPQQTNESLRLLSAVSHGSEDLLGIHGSDEEQEDIDDNDDNDDGGNEDGNRNRNSNDQDDRYYNSRPTADEALRPIVTPFRSTIEIARGNDDPVPAVIQSDHDENHLPAHPPPVRAVAADADDDDIDHDPVLLVAQKLFDHLQFGFQGCSTEQHRDQYQQHDEHVGGEHHSLSDIFNDANFPSVLSLNDTLTADRLARQPVPTALQWQTMFCGIPTQPSTHPLPMHVCLHAEPTRAVLPQVAFDVDSFLGFANSLACARKGFWYQPAPQVRQNMTKDVHLQTTMFHSGDDPEQPVRATRAMLRDVPHFLLGRIAGAHDITLHVLFPHLEHRGDKFISLSHDDYTRWFDRAFHPAIHHHCAAHYNQHLPASFRQAFAGSKARQVEGRKIETASYQTQQAVGYHLQPHLLGPIWEEVLTTTRNSPGLRDFRDPQLFFSAKGTKLQFKSTSHGSTLLDVIESFDSYLTDVLDLDLIDLDRTFIDIGKEICPGVSLLRTDVAGLDDQPQVYLWKRCCLEAHVKNLYDNKPPSATGRGQRYYHENMLRDATTMTSVPPKSSLLYQGGIRYFQLYGSVKEIWDAAKCKPFDNDGLEEMALDPTIRQGARHLAGGRSRDVHILEQAYCASKRRTHYALTDNQQKSYGIREEYRISWALSRALIDLLRPYPRGELTVSLHQRPDFVWSIQTVRYLNFLWRSADKFATGFEVVRARCRSDLVTWEQTKMMAMFLRCLRFVLAGYQLSRESALWWSRRERVIAGVAEPRIWYGLGFSNTLSRYGYCWLEPRIDWSQLTFRPTITDRVLFGNSVLRDQYLRRGRRVDAFFDTTKDLELALIWLEQYQDHDRIQRQLVSWIIHLCLRQFRIDVLSTIASEIQDEHRDEALRGLEPFCYEYFDEIMIDGVYLTAGNRSEFKTPSLLGRFLFSVDDGCRRQHWDVKPYRQLYRRARTGLTARFGRGSAIYQGFRRRFWRDLYGQHWILPQPSPQVFLQVTKRQQRMWYSLQRVDSGAVLTEASQWQWGRKAWQVGRPPGLPAYVGWDRGQWVAWMEQEGGG